MESGFERARCKVAATGPGFPVGGGGANSQGGYVSKNLYVKSKESGPLGGMHWQRPLDLPLGWAGQNLVLGGVEGGKVSGCSVGLG